MPEQIQYERREPEAAWTQWIEKGRKLVETDRVVEQDKRDWLEDAFYAAAEMVIVFDELVEGSKVAELDAVASRLSEARAGFVLVAEALGEALTELELHQRVR